MVAAFKLTVKYDYIWYLFILMDPKKTAVDLTVGIFGTWIFVLELKLFDTVIQITKELV